MSLSDENAGVVHALCKTELEDLGLQSALKKILDLECKHVVELGLGLVENSGSQQSADECVSLEKTLGVLVVQRQQLTGSPTQLRQRVRNPPNLVLVLETVLASKLELGIQTLCAKGSARDLVDLAAVCSWH